MLLSKDKIQTQLSNREIQVVDKLLDGLPNKLIARQLFISERTVKFHCTNIYRKLEVNGRYQLASLLN
ncbi:response regulator transcription factor [Alteromonadaceae bacterium M269]|nr:response regulator transcription factor [Alteromonadaceae bacterium M269]